MIENNLDKVRSTLDFLKSKFSVVPDLALVLGSGMGSIADEIEDQLIIPFGEIPNFPVPTVSGHAGRLVFGKLAGKSVVAMQGRFHFYEGYTMQEVTLPIRVFGLWGIKGLILSNAAGGLNPNQKLGEVMWIKDHINLMGANPLFGTHFPEWGERFPDMSQIYRPDWIHIAQTICNQNGQMNSSGVYIGVSGPTYETPAEYKAFSSLGADAIGMSTVPEAIVARQMGMSCLAFSVISDLGVEGKIEEISHQMVLENVQKAGKNMGRILKELISKITLK